jgi:hypothetical protein
MTNRFAERREVAVAGPVVGLGEHIAAAGKWCH